MGVAGFVGTSGRFPSESAAGFTRNQWPLSIGIGGRIGPEYSEAARLAETAKISARQTGRRNRDLLCRLNGKCRARHQTSP